MAEHSRLSMRLSEQLASGFRTRFAPAPTGRLHLGHAVNAVFVWSIAQAFHGSVIVRIEDHDRLRARPHFEGQILEDLDWLGLPSDNAACGLPMPIRQSERSAAYEAALLKLAQTGETYACRCSRREVAAAGTGSSDTPNVAELRYPGTCRSAAVSDGDTPARRLRLADDAVSFDDLRHGSTRQIPEKQCGDLLLRDRLSQWTYQFAVVVDDLAQGVGLIVRGDDLLASTGRQLLLRRQLSDSPPPLMLHHSLVLKSDGTKLSKSSGDAALAELRASGWSAARVLGHAAWLGGLQASAGPIEPGTLGTLWNAAG